MAITDLTGYKWTGNESLTITNTTTITYNVSGVYSYVGYSQETIEFTSLSYYNYEGRIGNLSIGGHLAYSGSWDGSPPYTIEFTGGADITSTELIAWLEANGTLEKMVAPVVQIRPFLKGIADAIRAKKGTTDIINAQDFASEITSIETGSSSNWTDEPGYSGTLTLTAGDTQFETMYLRNTGVEGTFDHCLVYGQINMGNTTKSYQYDDINMFMLITVNPIMPNVISNLVNVEILLSNDYNGVVFKPTADNWAINIEGGG